MRWHVRRAVSAVVVVGLVLWLPHLAAQTAGDNAESKAERRQAFDLFNQNKHLQALPLFEDLAQKNPKDPDVLLGLATCLVSHASTLDDEKDAAQERLRARGLLLKAKELGNTSTLLENLLQTVPADGVIHYSQSPVDEAMRRAEAAFARQDFEAAVKNYSRALELDPGNYSATLFIGDTYFAKADFAKAGEWYERAAQVDPNRETAYRYHSDMLIKQGEMARARAKAIQAVVAEPYNPITWRALQYWAKANSMQLRSIHINVKSQVEQKDDKNITLTLDDKQSAGAGAAWMAYGMVKTLWRMEDFKKNFPQEKQYRHSLLEESQALSSAAEILAGSKGKKKRAGETTDPDLAILLELYQAKMIAPYVLLNAADEGIAKDYDAYRAKNRDKLEAYLSEFVAPPAPAGKN
jgi:tetratricopeptide (TPR) repeat protein